MTQEEKELLLRDLCARLPYGVMIEITSDGGIMEASYDMRLDAGLLADLLHSEDDFNPYLRPMSSMTEEERDEYTDIKKGECNGCVLTGKGDPDTEFLLVDWLNANHFDYRGLIEKGLALEAPEDMYKN